MDWGHQHFITQYASPPKRQPERKYGELFWNGATIRERYENGIEQVKTLCTQQADNLYLGKDSQTLIRDAIDYFVGADPFPNLMFDGSVPTQRTNVPGTVGVVYRIPIDKNPDVLIWKLPPEVESNGLSEYAFIEGGVAPRANVEDTSDAGYYIELKYVFPQQVWDNRTDGWLSSVIENDIEWLKSVIGDFHDAFDEHAKRLTSLIYIAVSEKWEQAMDMAAELASVPLPVSVADGRQAVEKGRRYKVHKPYLFGHQRGVCHGCKRRFCYKHMEVDHILPRKKGGEHLLRNLQLLCEPCNRLKAHGTQQELEAELKTNGPRNAACSEC